MTKVKITTKTGDPFVWDSNETTTATRIRNPTDRSPTNGRESGPPNNQQTTMRRNKSSRRKARKGFLNSGDLKQLSEVKINDTTIKRVFVDPKTGVQVLRVERVAPIRSGASLESAVDIGRQGSKKNKKKRKITLISKRGSRIDEHAVCDRCLKHRHLQWHYAESDVGSVRLCSACKAKLKPISLFKPDALDRADTGGGFEGNKRKH